MIYAVPDIVKMVREAAGYGAPHEPLLADCSAGRLPLHRLIEISLPTALRKVYAEAPVALLQGAEQSMAHCGIYWHEEVDSTYSGHMMLPSDFWRLVVFEMSDWATAVYEAHDCRSKRYQLTASRFAALRGTQHRPVVVLSQHPEGLALEFYSCSSARCTIAKAAYIPLPSITDDYAIDIPERILQPFICQAAQIVRSQLPGV